MKNHFEKEWNENEAQVEWHRLGRINLNIAIRAYNQWLLDGSDKIESWKVHGIILWSIAQQNEPDDYKEVYERMITHIREIQYEPIG